MTISPVIERELRVALRKSNPRKSRFKYAGIGVGMGVLCLFIQAMWGGSSFISTLHRWLFYVGLYAAAIETLQLTADLFTRERQSGTLGFLFLAGLSVRELFGGKVLGAFLVASGNLMALAPALAIPFLTGGVPLYLFAATVACLATVLIFTLALVCLASALWEDESTARVGAIVISAFLCLVPLGVDQLFRWSAHPASPVWCLLSPAWGPLMVKREFSVSALHEFWLNIAVTLAWSVLLFLAAGFALGFSWKQEVSGATPRAWRSRLLEWIHGNRHWRQKQAHWLSVNPCIWLGVRNRQPVRLARVATFLIAVVSALCFCVMPRGWLKPSLLITVAAALHFTVAWIVNFTAAKRLADTRRTNAVELLLTTPLEVRDFVHGQMMALDVQFRPLFLTNLIMSIGIMLGGLFLCPLQSRALLSYGMVWGVVIVCICRRVWPKSFKNSVKAMWGGFNTGLPAMVTARCMGFQGAWYFNMFFYWGTLIGIANRFPTGSWLEFCIVAIVAPIVAGMMLLSHHFGEHEQNIEKWLLNEFRLIAPEPMPDPKDPRLKKWNIGDRLYHHKYQQDPLKGSLTTNGH